MALCMVGAQANANEMGLAHAVEQVRERLQRHRARNEPFSFSLAAIPLMYWPQYGHVYTKSEHARQSTACPHGLSATHSPAWLHAMQRRPSSELLKTEAGSDDSRTKSRAGVLMAATSPRL